MPTKSLVPKLALGAVVRVIEKGAQKDGRKAGDWAEITDQEHWFDKAARHMDAWEDGNFVDGDSGESSLAHAIADLMILLEHELKEAKNGTEI